MDVSIIQKGIIQSNHPIESLKNESVFVDYDNLKKLLKLDGLSLDEGVASTEDANKKFIKEISKFVSTQKIQTSPSRKFAGKPKITDNGQNNKSLMDHRQPIVSSNLQLMKPSENTSANPIASKQSIRANISADKSGSKMLSLKTKLNYIWRILKKLPFERKVEENMMLRDLLTNREDFQFLTQEVEGDEDFLLELCNVAVLDSFEDAEMTAFGHSGLHLILKGSVRSNSNPAIKSLQLSGPKFLQQIEQNDANSIPSSIKINAGSFFGSLEAVEGLENGTKVLSVVSEEPCEFLKISTDSYRRIKEKYYSKLHAEKLSLLQAQNAYQLWPNQALLKVVSVLDWAKYPSNKILSRQGQIAPIMAFIKSGTCLLLRELTVNVTQKNGKKIERRVQVVMDKIGPGQSFGEVSVLDGQPINCTVYTETELHVAKITGKTLEESLDQTTRKLLRQSSEPLLKDIKEEDVEREYVKQENMKDWNMFKHGVIMDVINYQGIRPGLGKWKGYENHK